MELNFVNLRACKCWYTFSSSQKADDDFGACPNKHLACIFGIVGILESIGQNITVHYNGSMER